MAGDGQDRAHALGWEFSVRPNRPKTFARNPTIPHKVPNVSFYDEGPGVGSIRLFGPKNVRVREERGAWVGLRSTRKRKG